MCAVVSVHAGSTTPSINIVCPFPPDHAGGIPGRTQHSARCVVVNAHAQPQPSSYKTSVTSSSFLLVLLRLLIITPPQAAEQAAAVDALRTFASSLTARQEELAERLARLGDASSTLSERGNLLAGLHWRLPRPPSNEERQLQRQLDVRTTMHNATTCIHHILTVLVLRCRV